RCGDGRRHPSPVGKVSRAVEPRDGDDAAQPAAARRGHHDECHRERSPAGRWPMNAGRVMVPAAIALSAALAWRPASGREQPVLAGRPRPLLQGNWSLPRDLRFSANAFQPPDAKSAFVKTSDGVRAFIVAADDDPVVRITAAIPIGRAYEQTGEADASELVSRVLTQSVRDRLGRAFVGRVQVDQEVDATRVSLQVLPDDWKPALHAVVDALRQTSFEAPATFRTGQGFAIQT